MSTYTQSAVYLTMLAVGVFLGISIGHRNQFSGQIFRRSITLNSNQESPNATAMISESASLATWQRPPAVKDSAPLGIENTDEPWWENFDSNRTLYVSPYTGLANTLQAIGSAFTIGYKHNIKIKFVFNRQWFGPATWDDLFMFPKVSFNHTFPDGEFRDRETTACKVAEPIFQWANGKSIEWVEEDDGSGEFGCVSTCCWREPPFPHSVLWFYRILRPAEHLQQIIDRFKEEQSWQKYQWVGVHIRRTDNINTMKGLMKYETQKELKGRVNTSSGDTILPVKNYITAMKEVQKAWPIHHLGAYQIVKPVKFFLATDKDEVRSEVLEVFDENTVVYYEHGLESTELRKQNWGMKLAVIDMFLLGSCKVVLGTPFSTFSEASYLIGGGIYLEPNFLYQNHMHK